jgi:hypothetical protein
LQIDIDRNRSFESINTPKPGTFFSKKIRKEENRIERTWAGIKGKRKGVREFVLQRTPPKTLV